MTPTERERRERRALEDLLERGRWPTGLELTDHDRRTIEHNLERLLDGLHRLAELVPDPAP